MIRPPVVAWAAWNSSAFVNEAGANRLQRVAGASAARQEVELAE